MILEYISPIYLYAILGILGLIIGSFLNVVILRKNTDEGINGRSHCTKCNYKLTWKDLIPVLSYISLKGKCRKCEKKISIQYPLVEIFSAIIFVLVAHFSSNIYEYVYNIVIFSILICIFVYDMYHKIIPNRWSYSFAIISFSYLLISTWGNFNTLDILAGLIFFTPFWMLWYISKGKWIGLGDGKLSLGIGWFLGFTYGLSAIILGFWIGAVFALTLMLMDRLNIGIGSITMKTEIPFGPFLILGVLIQFFFQLDVLGITYYI